MGKFITKSELYEEGLKKGLRRQREAAELLKKLYGDQIRINNIIDAVGIESKHRMRKSKSQKDIEVEVYDKGEKIATVNLWCESLGSSKGSLEWYIQNKKMYMKYKSFKTMEDDEYLIKPLLPNGVITDIAVMQRDEINLENVIYEADIGGPGDSAIAVVSVKNHGYLVSNKEKTKDDFIDALLYLD